MHVWSCRGHGEGSTVTENEQGKFVEREGSGPLYKPDRFAEHYN